MIELFVTLLAFILSFGADVSVRPEVKASFCAWLRRYKPGDLRHGMAEYSYDKYVSIFGQGLLLRRFWARSIVIYFVALIFLLIYVRIFFPSTFDIISTAPYFNSRFENIAMLASVILFAVFFTFANAQTLYFLELLKEQPTAFRFWLIAYSDVIITASITIFGLAAAMTLASYILTVAPSEEVQFEISFEKSLEGDFISKHHKSNAGPAHISRSDLETIHLPVDYTHLPSERYSAKRIYSFEVEALRSAADPLILLDEQRDRIVYLNSRENERDYFPKNPKFERDIRFYWDEKIIDVEELESDPSVLLVQVESEKRILCQDLRLSLDSDVDRIVFKTKTPLSEVSEACLKNDRLIVLGDAKIHRGNINWSMIFNAKIMRITGVVARNPIDAMGIYLFDNPYTFLDSTAFRNDLLVRDDDFSVVGLAVKAGAEDNFFLQKHTHMGNTTVGPPYGSMLVASLLTSLPSMMILIILILIAPMNFSIVVLQRMDAFLSLENYPLTFFCAAVIATYFAIFSILVILG